MLLQIAKSAVDDGANNARSYRAIGHKTAIDRIDDLGRCRDEDYGARRHRVNLQRRQSIFSICLN